MAARGQLVRLKG